MPRSIGSPFDDDDDDDDNEVPLFPCTCVRSANVTHSAVQTPDADLLVDSIYDVFGHCVVGNLLLNNNPLTKIKVGKCRRP